MNFRSDLAFEYEAPEQNFSGLRRRDEMVEDCHIHKLEILDREASLALGKPIGTYVTLELPPLGDYAEVYGTGMDCVARELGQLLPAEGAVLVAGLGNQNMTPDALGPRCCSQILATRHIDGELAKSAGLGNLRPVACLSPGVLGQTGIESCELILAATKAVQPVAVVTIDALAARSLSRLGCTIQITDAGLTPGSGVGNARREISQKTLGIPVIALGVPTVVDAVTLVQDLTKSAPELLPESEQMMVTPREVDLLISRAAKLCAMALNRALQPHLEIEDILQLIE